MTSDRPFALLRSVALAALLSVPVWSGCAGEAGSPRAEAAAARTGDFAAVEGPERVDSGREVARVAGKTLTMADLGSELAERLHHLEAQHRQERDRRIEEALMEAIHQELLRVEAADRGITVGELLDEEIRSRVSVTGPAIAAWYESNESRLSGRSLEDLRPQIEEFLESQEEQRLREELFQRLWEEHGVVTLLEPYRVQLDDEGAPALGPEDAPVTLVEFSDFQCPYCRRFYPTLHRLREAYGDRLRIVYRQFPIPNLHAQAFKASEASLCAHQQGRFWEMHDRIFDDAVSALSEQSVAAGMSVAALKEKASRLRLDRDRFDRCLDSGEYADAVRADIATGRRAGVDGTPALFVNGIRVPGGAVPFESVARIINDELRRAGIE